MLNWKSTGDWFQFMKIRKLLKMGIYSLFKPYSVVTCSDMVGATITTNTTNTTEPIYSSKIGVSLSSAYDLSRYARFVGSAGNGGYPKGTY